MSTLLKDKVYVVLSDVANGELPLHGVRNYLSTSGNKDNTGCQVKPIIILIYS